MKFEIEITNTENIKNLSFQQKKDIERIVVALIQSGGLTGVKGGRTSIHFDEIGVFKAIQLDYFPYKARR